MKRSLNSAQKKLQQKRLRSVSQPIRGQQFHMWLSKEDGWSRAGQPLRNQDLWQLVRKVFLEYQSLGYEVAVRRVPAHVGIVGNERADRLAAAAAKRAHQNCVLSAEEREERRLESLADALVAGLLASK